MRPNRREFLTTTSGLTFATALPWVGGQCATIAASAKTCILVHLLGGPPHLDTFDLKPDAPDGIRGPFNPIETNVPGLTICEHLPRLAQRANRYAILRSLSHQNHNHTPMIYYSLTGRPVERPEVDNDVRAPQRSDHPHLGAVLAHLKPSPSGLPAYVAIPEVATRSSISGEFKRGRVPLRGGGGGFLGPLFDPLVVDPIPGSPPPLGLPDDVTIARLDRRAALMRVLDGGAQPFRGAAALSQLQDRAVSISGAGPGRPSPFAVNDVPDTSREPYGDHRFGRALLLARRLAEAEVPAVAIHWNEMTICDGWDTHAKNFEALQSELLPMLDQGLSALIDDLAARGLLDQTLVVVFGEFGRTPRINKDAGRDHWGSCQSVLLAGGGIRGGTIVGASDRVGAYPAAEAVDPTDLHATLFHCMGLDADTLIRDQLGRPFPISTGRVISSLV